MYVFVVFLNVLPTRFAHLSQTAFRTDMTCSSNECHAQADVGDVVSFSKDVTSKIRVGFFVPSMNSCALFF